MAAIESYLGQLDPVYKPQADVVNQQLAEVPKYYEALDKSEEQKRTNAFGDITAGANSRGMLFSGIPLDEQAKYTGTNYLPALAANARQRSSEEFGLKQTLNDINSKKYETAMNMKQGDDQRFWQQQQQDYQNKLAQANADRDYQRQLSVAKAASGGGGGGSAAPAAARPNYNAVASAIEDGARRGETWNQQAKYLKAQGIDPSVFDMAFKRIYGQKEGNINKYGYNRTAETSSIKKYGG